MNHLPQDELLSAYLDGELTAEEQAEAERLLAASPAARQLLDELWAVERNIAIVASNEGGRRPQPAGVARGRAANAHRGRTRRRGARAAFAHVVAAIH